MIQTQITSLAVYRSGCKITRSARLLLQEGAQSLKLCGPGPYVDAASVRISVPEGLEGSGVQLSYPTEEETAEVLKDFRKKKERLARNISDLEEQIALWKQNADFSGKENISISDMTSFLEQLPARLSRLQEERDQLLEEQENLEKEWNKLTEKALLPYVSVDIKAPAAGEYPLELSYFDSSAAWSPSYEIHAQDEASGQLLLRLRGRIGQDSGEDWSQVKIRLFSGNPSLSGTIPALFPERLSFFEPPVFHARATGAMAGLGMAQADMAAPMMAEEAMAERESFNGQAPKMKMSQLIRDSGQTIQGDTMTEYELEGLWNIRNGQSILCDIRTDVIPCRYQVVAVPKYAEEAFLSAQVKTADLEEMQQVEAAVYLKGSFSGNVFLNPSMTEEDYDLSLGKDETVKVKRTQKKKVTSQTLLKGQKKTEYEYEIAVSSRKPRSCQVLIKDQIPITEEKTIVVESQNLSGGELEESTGLLKWQFELGPGESRQIHLAYSTAWPKDKQVRGI